MALSSFASTIKALLLTERRFSNNKVLGTEGLAIADVLALCVLAAEQSASKQDLARSLGMRQNHVGRIISNLESRGLIESLAGQDGEVSVSLSGPGRSLHERLEGVWADWIDKTPEIRSALSQLRKAIRTIQESFVQI